MGCGSTETEEEGKVEGCEAGHFMSFEDVWYRYKASDWQRERERSREREKVRSRDGEIDLNGHLSVGYLMKKQCA